MSTQPDWLRDVAVPTLKQGKRVLAVEGDDDRRIYEAWLKEMIPAGTNLFDRLVVVKVGGRDQVLQGLIWYRDLPNPPPAELFGLVDRDEWDAETIAEKRSDIPRLLVNEHRHCIESYFTDPDEIAAALVAKDAGRYSPHMPAMRAAIEAGRAAWVDHWALWVTMCRVSRRLSEGLFPGHFHDSVPLPDDAVVEQQLEDWASIVAPATVFEAFQQERDAARARPSREQFQGCIHAKKFFDRVVVPAALHPFGPHDRMNWMLKLAKWMPDAPGDLRPLLSPLFP